MNKHAERDVCNTYKLSTQLICKHYSLAYDGKFLLIP